MILSVPPTVNPVSTHDGTVTEGDTSLVITSE